MKRNIIAIALITLLGLTTVQTINAQDQWYQGRSKGIYSVEFGGTQGIIVGDNSGIYVTPLGTARQLSFLGAAINASGEYKVWKFIGLGWQTGINIYPYPSYYGLSGSGVTAVGLSIPLIVKANVHIMDAAGVSIADKLDVYAGLGVGGGPLISVVSGGGTSQTNVAGIIHVGPQVGVRYWFNSKVAIFGEFGWGATFAAAGVTF
jgi:hypothetical protein